jgi:hypothetical protein
MTVTIVDAVRPVTGGMDTDLDPDAAPCLVTGGVDTRSRPREWCMGYLILT